MEIYQNERIRDDGLRVPTPYMGRYGETMELSLLVVAFLHDCCNRHFILNYQQ